MAEETVAIRVNESQQGGADLNGDSDASDAVLFVTVLPVLFADDSDCDSGFARRERP